MKVSLITVTYNSSDTIADCVKSVTTQTYPDIEHIIVDGASTDNTIGIIRSLPTRVKRIVSEPDKGIYDAMNKGIQLATGDIIGFLNSDDQFYSVNTVSIIINCFENRDIDAVFGNLKYSNNYGKTVRLWKSRSFINGLFEKSWTPAHPTFYCKRELYEKFGLYKTNYRIAADVELMLRFLEVHKINSYFIDEILVDMRAGGVSNQGFKSTITIIKEVKRAFKENNLQFNLAKYILYKGLKLNEYIFPT